ncbi:MAG: hypothetical protein C4562_00700, partial [Actinobacteria bacterium]
MIEYGETTDYGYQEVVHNSDVYHSMTLKKLRSGTTYHYRIKGVDAYNNAAVSGDYTFKTADFSPYSVQVDPTSNSAVVSWVNTPNSLADAAVKYWPLDGTAETDAKTEGTKEVSRGRHSITISDLKPATTYKFRVYSFDSDLNLAMSSIDTFETLGLLVTDVSVETDVSIATITWKTNVESDSHVEYGLTAKMGKVTGDYRMTTNHKVVIEKLLPGTKYYYAIKSKDDYSNIASRGERTFETKPFKISSIKVGESTNSATVSWTTNIASVSTVEYRAGANAASKSIGDDKLATNHSVLLKNLKDSTTYYFKIKSRDKDDNLAESDGIQTFTTKSLGNILTQDPDASKINEMELTATSAKISWKTSTPTT